MSEEDTRPYPTRTPCMYPLYVLPIPSPPCPPPCAVPVNITCPAPTPLLTCTQAEDNAAASYRTGKGPNEQELPDNDETLASFRAQSLKMMGADAQDRDFGGEVGA